MVGDTINEQGYIVSLNILAFDPGGTTGCAMRLDGEFSAWVVEANSSDGSYYRDVLAFITPRLDVVIYERFASSQATSHYAILTTELCGAIQGYVACLNNPLVLRPGLRHTVELVRHEPQNRLGFMTEAKALVQATNGDRDGKYKIHSIDATAHLLAYEHFGDSLRKRNWGTGISGAITNA